MKHGFYETECIQRNPKVQTAYILIVCLQIGAYFYVIKRRNKKKKLIMEAHMEDLLDKGNIVLLG